MELIDDILENVKIRLNITDDSQDELFKILIEDTIRNVLNYINRWELPKELKPTVAQLVVDGYSDVQSQMLGISGESVSSINDNGSSVSFLTLETTAKIAAIAIDRIPKLNMLNSFRLPYKLKKTR